MSATALPKLALICGGGAAAVEVADYLARSQRPYCVFRLAGLADPALRHHPGHEVELGNFGQLFALLKSEACASICMLGYVNRPDYQALPKDGEAERLMPAIEAAGRGGDDQLLRQVAAMFIAQGYAIEGAHQADPELVLPAGCLIGPEPDASDRHDVDKAIEIAITLGQLDVGQAVVVARGLCLALEAQEGTEAMLKRVSALPGHLRGSAEVRAGVLVKWIKPIQDSRLDMPAIGVKTVEDVAVAGLKGIVGMAHNLIMIDRTAILARAKALGIFILGIEG